MVEKQHWVERIFNLCSYCFLLVFTLFCLAPFWIMIVASFTDEVVLRIDGYLPWARKWSLEAYRWVLRGPEIQSAYRVTTFVTLTGTFLSVIIMSGLAYVLSIRRLKGRLKLAFYIYFTMIFSGGVIPWFITCRMLGLYDNIWALIVPMLVNPWWVFVLRNFFSSLPVEIIESARIDGASDAKILYSIVLPLSLPAVVTAALFTGVAYWNDWWHGVILMSFSKIRPLAVIILRMLNSFRALLKAMEQPGTTVDVENLPHLSVRMATTVITIGPIILLYPFVQRYFIKGLTIGAIKG